MSSLIQITDKAGRKLGEPTLDLSDARAKLAETNGQGYWRSLEELSEQPGFGEMLKREFPGQAPKDWAPLARRDFVKLMGAALALAGLSGCAFQPPEKIVPYVEAPEEMVPGIPLFYATAMPFMGYGLGLLAESHEGRPTKVEGNEEHPSSQGRTDLWAQASVLNLYDPDRSQFIRQNTGSSDWQSFVGAVGKALAASNRGAGVAILTESITSPTALDLISQFQKKYPAAKWHSFEPINSDNVREGTRLAFGRELHPIYRYDRANVIVSLDCDFMLEDPNRVLNARQYVSKRKLTEGQTTMNRLYVIESTPSITGAAADHRLPMKAAAVDAFARALAGAVGVAGVSGTVEGDQKKWVDAIAADLKANRGSALVVAGAHQPAAVHALAHAITARLGSIGGPNGTIEYTALIEGNTKVPGQVPPRHNSGLGDLVKDMNEGRVKSVIIFGANPVYSAPADLKFGDALAKVPFKAHIGPYQDETGEQCDWHIPEAHYLEAWGDVRAYDGTVSIVQPIVQPLYSAAKSQIEVLNALVGNPDVSPYDTVRGYWQGRPGAARGNAFDKFWQSTVHNGVVPNSKATPIVAAVSAGLAGSLPPVTTVGSGLEVSFRPDPTIWDGRFANNPWLQECPKPVSKITWDNAIFVAPETAEKNGWTTNKEAKLTVNGQSVTGGIFLLPGQPLDSITVHLGYGRTTSGKVGTGPGFNANLIRTSEQPFFTSGAEVELTGGVFKLATTTHHNLIAPGGKDTTLGDALLRSNASKTKLIDNILTPESAELDIDGTHGRDIIRAGTFAEWAKHISTDKKLQQEAKLPVDRILDKKGVPLAFPVNPKEFRDGVLEGEKDRPWQENRELEGNPSFYPRNSDPLALTPYKDDEVNKVAEAEAKKKGRDHVTHAWGMTVDLQSCIGCNACVIGCQSENNSAVVGKDQVLMGREMHWIRIDTYYRGSYQNPEVYFEPMMCQHCEKAPCAPVCPFNATMNSTEGINEQVYNRCVGTKYCENNCPYKVRRFNFLQYSDQQTPVIQLMSNPDVTVRSRGVMEKCTYCIQRVNAAKWQAEKEERDIVDGDIQVACQQACPTDAIVFGDINDPLSKVSRLKRSDLTFGLLTDLNTMPRTSYLARFKNPNPAMADFDKPHELLGERGGEGHGEGGHGEEGAHAEGGHEAPSGAGHETNDGAEHGVGAEAEPAGANHSEGAH